MKHSRHDGEVIHGAIHAWKSEANEEQAITEAMSVMSVTLHYSR